MVYSDLIFVLGLFPITAVLSVFDRSAEYKNLILILASLLFFSWGKPFMICLIFLSLFVDWGLALLGQRFRDKSGAGGKFLLALVGLIDLAMNVGILLVFGNNTLFSDAGKLHFDSWILPLGIGFYTLRGFSYVYDVLKGHIDAEKNVFCLMTYMLSYHLMLAGPLVRYGEIEPSIRHREITVDMMNRGLTKICIGLGKIILLAAVFERIKLAGLNSNEITTLGCWLGMISFFGQCYFTFTGLCDMSKGLGLCGGFEYPDNYLDINPDGLFKGMVESYNSTVVKFFSELVGMDKERPVGIAAFSALIAVAALGLWYKVKINYLIVFAAAGLLIGLEILFLEKLLSRLPAAVKYIYIFLTALVIFGGLYFDSLYGYKKWLLALVGVNTKYTLSVEVKNAVLNNITLIVIAMVIFLPFLKRLVTRLCEKMTEKGGKVYGFMRISQTVLTAFVFLMSIITVAVQYSGV